MNFHPDSLSIKELVRYGEDYSDPLVRRLAELFDEIISYLPVEENVEYFGTVIDRISDLKSDLDYAQELEQDARRQNQKITEQVRALKFDLDENEQVAQNTTLKARVFELNEANQQLKADVSNLKKDLYSLQEKYNTWKVIAS